MDGNELCRDVQQADDPWLVVDEAFSLLLRLLRGHAGALFVVSPMPDANLTLIHSRSIDQDSLDVAGRTWAEAPPNVRNGLPAYGHLLERLHLLLPCLEGSDVRGLVYVELRQHARRLPSADLTTFAGILGRALQDLFGSPGVPTSTVLAAIGPDTMDAARENLILLLQRNEWNVSRVARLQGVTRMTVYNRLRRLGIPRERVQRGPSRRQNA